MINGAVYILNKAKPLNSGLGWDKLTFIERRVSRTVTFEVKEEPSELVEKKIVTRTEYEWIVFTHSDHGYVTMNEDEFVEELCSGCYELHNWELLHQTQRGLTNEN